jgi:hypothetical protein
VHTTDVPIIAAQARAYIGVLQKMDRLYTLSGTANLLGVIDSAQRAEVEFGAKKAVRAFRSILQTEVTRLYREAERIMKEQHQAGRVDVAMAAVVREHGNDIAEFDKSSQQEQDEDSTMDLGGADPSQVIADASAAAAAAAAAAGAGTAGAGTAKKAPRIKTKPDSAPQGDGAAVSTSGAPAPAVTPAAAA